MSHSKLDIQPSIIRKNLSVIIMNLFIVILLPAVMGGTGHCANTYETFFAGTDYELNVYKIHGKKPGKTMLIIGGIQGDEPGGFLSADLYADMKLEKGNLIVVPRANFYSILLNRRQINEDMNRKFSESSRTNYEAQIVMILKQLISESDCLLNLHDGSGFYSETWKSSTRNPTRYGQSIIVDCESVTAPKTDKVLKLGEIGRQVIEQINSHIDDPLIHFHFNNHRTNEMNTLHPEQRKSATYYALFKRGIPAFGIETSKLIPIETRIYHHKLAINAFMKIFNIKPEIPGINVEKPTIKYIVVKVNDETPIVVADGETLNITPGNVLKIIHIEGNYDRGFSADIEGYGSINDLNKPFAIDSPTQVIVRKDHDRCGKIHIVPDKNNRKLQTISRTPRVLYFKCRINRKEQYLPNGAHVDVLKGDQIELIDVGTMPESCSGLVVNFKGFVGDKKANTGEDRGYIINTDNDLMKRYSLYRKGRIYQAVVTKDDDQVMGRLFFDIKEPSFQYIVFQLNDGIKQCFFPEDTISLQRNDIIKLVDIKTNVPRNFNVSSRLSGKDVTMQLHVGSSIDGTKLHGETDSYEVIVTRGNINIGLVPLRISDTRLAWKGQRQIQ